MTTIICTVSKFLSTLSLRRATHNGRINLLRFEHFYPRSPCGERHTHPIGVLVRVVISIHALLAESDRHWQVGQKRFRQFLSTLSLRRATFSVFASSFSIFYFYPRSPCGERLNGIGLIVHIGGFLSTLSLRRATLLTLIIGFSGRVFLSTLSLRRATHYDNYNLHCVEISIHALLAESDKRAEIHASSQQEFLSTLSLRRATKYHRADRVRACISIHALLAESDKDTLTDDVSTGDFYPRSPCGERRYLINTYHRIFGISIHALLAESDPSENVRSSP